MKTTLDLPDELIREVKIRAVVQGRTVKDLVAEFLRQGLGLPALNRGGAVPTSSRVKIGKEGLPIIQCDSLAQARHMKVRELLLLEQEAQVEEDKQHVGLSL